MLAAVAWLAALKIETIAQARIVLAVSEAQDEKPHTLASLVKLLDMPFSTASRVVWGLTPDGGDVGVIHYAPHPTDRRKKQLRCTAQIPLELMKRVAGVVDEPV